MTIAFVIMLIVALIQQRTNKRLSNRLEEIEARIKAPRERQARETEQTMKSHPDYQEFLKTINEQ